MSFKKREEAPSNSNKYWVHTSNDGLNECLEIDKKTGSCIPNCVGYAWGRFYEILGKKPKLCKANAEMWYGYSDGYKRGKTPKVGAVICWSKGKVGNSSDGAGHVAIVEEVYEDGSILTSNSGYGSTRFYMKKIAKGYKLSGYDFQGFIYNPATESTGSSQSTSSNQSTSNKTETKYTTMTVVAKSGCKLRSGAGTGYKVIGSVKKGAKVKVVKTIKNGSDTWYKLTGGEYICGKQGSTIYVK